MTFNRVSVPAFKIPPPETESPGAPGEPAAPLAPTRFPLLIVIAEMLTVLPDAISKTRKLGVPPAVLRCTVRWVAPSPVIVRFLLISSSALVKLICWSISPASKVIVPPSHTSAMAWRRLPAPLSKVFTTVTDGLQVLTT